MKKIIFCDTNILYGTIRYFIENGKVNESFLKDLCKESMVVISTTVLDELFEIYKRYNDFEITSKIMQNFIKEIGFRVSKSKDVNDEILTYVKDIDDGQILQDAIDVGADILFTNNLKDFFIDKIEAKFGLIISNKL